MKRLLLTSMFAWLAWFSQAQIAKSFNYSGDEPVRSGTYVAKHPTDPFFYEAAMVDLPGSESKMSLTKLDQNGNTIWYAEKVYPLPFANFNAIGDVLVTPDYVFVSVYTFTFAPNDGEFQLIKYDHNGNFILSIGISPTGLDRTYCNMAMDPDGKICTALKTSSDVILYYRIDPATMSIVGSTPVAVNPYTNTNLERSMFVQMTLAAPMLIYNAADSIRFVKLTNAPAVVSNDYLLNPDGDATDVEYDGTNFKILTNEYFSSFTAADNPARILTTTTSGSVLQTAIFPVTVETVFTNLALDNADIYVCGRSTNFHTSSGVILKISSGVMTYEHPLERTNLSEIDVAGNYFYASGSQHTQMEYCQNTNTGSTFIRHKKTVAPEFQVVAPRMRLTGNNVDAIISCTADNFRDTYAYNDNFQVDGAGNQVYASGLLMGGEDINGQLHFAGDAHANPCAAGPITDYAEYTQLERDKWERVWVVTKDEIDAHIQAYLMGDFSYVMPEAILHWPAHGNVSKGQSANLARFKDLNGNQIYEPLVGEYPLIKGDFCALSIYNDLNADTANDCSSSGTRIGIEILEYAYGFNCNVDSAMQNTLFVQYEIINKSTQTLYNTYVGHTIDHDINSPMDDYISSDPLRGIFYAREADQTGSENAYMILGSTSDEDALDNAYGIGAYESPNGLNYGNGIADDERLGMTHFLYYNIGGGANGDPNLPNDYYRYMQSIWQNGAQVLYGGDGFSSGTTAQPSNFMFPGSSDNLWYCTGGINPGFDWSEEQAGNAPGDRRGLASSGPFVLTAFDTIYFDIAYVTGMENTVAGYTGHDAMISYVDSVRTYFEINAVPCGGNFDFYEPFAGTYPSLGEEENPLQTLLLYPNPTTGAVVVSGLPTGSTIRVMSLTGELILTNVGIDSLVEFDLSGLADGVYFVQVSTENFTETVRLVKR